MKNLFIKHHNVFTILKCIILIISLVNIYSFYINNIQLFNEKIVSYSTRFLIGKYILFLMLIHIIIEASSIINMFSYYSNKHIFSNYFLSLVSISISLPLFYNYTDDFMYYSGDVSFFLFLLPLGYFISGIFDFTIARNPSVQNYK